MRSSSHTIELRSAPADVWAFVSDLAETPRWRTTIESVTAPSELVLGAQMPGTTRVFGRRWRWTIEVTELDPPHRLSYRATGIATVDVSYVVEAGEVGGTRFTFSGSSPSRLAPLAQRTLNREAESALANLRRIVDGPDPGAA